MAYQAVFKRYEIKYMLTKEQKAMLLSVMEPYMALDDYGRTTIRNIYFDTPNYRLIRRSIEKPVYKEKLRVRSYSTAGPDDKVFVELKKKYESVVYKRRVSLPRDNAMAWLCERAECKKNTQITSEINYFLDYYGELSPAVFLSYEREAYYSKDESDFRVTFDENILSRQTDLSLGTEVYGNPLLEEGKTLMEIKCSGGIPLWMVHALSEAKIYKTSFSKYGTAYQRLIFPQMYQIHKDDKLKETLIHV